MYKPTSSKITYKQKIKHTKHKHVIIPPTQFLLTNNTADTLVVLLQTASKIIEVPTVPIQVILHPVKFGDKSAFSKPNAIWSE